MNRVFKDPLQVMVLIVAVAVLVSTLPLAIATPSVLKGKALVVKISGLFSEIDKPAYDYVVGEGLKLAESENVPLIVIVDSYGGYLDTMFKMGEAFFNARVPVIGYVPDKAFSAACLILLPMHIVAVGPTATVGAAQPIMYNPATGQVTFINESKIINPILAKIKLWAEVRGRNVTAAEGFVLHNYVFTGKQVVKVGIANFVAYSLQDLLNKIRGLKVNITVNGVVVKTVVIDVDGYEYLQPSINIVFFAILRNAVVQSLLWFIGVFGTIAALLSGRFDILPLTLVMLLLAIVAVAGGLPTNYVAIALIVLGSVMLAIELFVTPGFGVLGASGIAAIIFGLLLLPIIPGRSLASASITQVRTIVGVVGGGLASFFTFILYKAVRITRSKPKIRYEPVKAVGKALDRIEPGRPGTVMVEGEYWTAVSDEVIEPGEEIEVIGRKEFTLIVRKRRRSSS